MKHAYIKSIAAVLVGFISIAVLAVIVDTILQALKVLPITGEKKFEDWQSLLALTYHILFVIFGAYLAARLAPRRAMAHALAVGALGIVLSVIGLNAIIEGDLAPAWYGWALIIASLPATWIGGKLFIMSRAKNEQMTKAR